MCSLVPLRKAAYVWYRTMTAILLRRERGRNNAEMYAVLVVTPPPLFSAKLRFKRGGVTTREYGISYTEWVLIIIIFPVHASSLLIPTDCGCKAIVA